MRIFVLKSPDENPIPTESNLSVQIAKENLENKELSKLIATKPDLFTFKKGKDY